MSSFWEHKIHVHVFSMHLCQCCTFHTNTIAKKMPCANNKGEVAWNTVVDVQCRHYACACSRSHVALQFFIFLFHTFFLLSLFHSLGRERKETRRRQTWVSMNANAMLAPYLYNLNEIQTWKIYFSEPFIWVLVWVWWGTGRSLLLLLFCVWPDTDMSFLDFYDFARVFGVIDED